MSVERVIDAFMTGVSCALDADHGRRDKSMPVKKMIKAVGQVGNLRMARMSKSAPFSRARRMTGCSTVAAA